MTEELSGTYTSYAITDTTTADHRAVTNSKSDGTFNISDQMGTTEDGKAPECYESQIHLALLNLRSALVASGCEIADIVKLDVSVVDDSDSRRQLHTRHIQKFLGVHRPSINSVPVSHLTKPEWLIKIDATAIHGNAVTSQILNSDKGTDPSPEVDVVIIGAGLSGLIAARDVLRAGLSCVILEARDRVGGKTWSQPLKNGKGIVEVGAAWINDTNQSRMYELAKQSGAELIEQNTTGRALFQDYDGTCSPFMYGELPPFGEATKKHLAEIRDMCEAHCQELDVLRPKDSSLDSLTFQAYLEKNGASSTAVEIAKIWTRAMLGQEPTDISALFFLNYCKSGGGLLQMRSDRKDGGQYLRIRQGTQSISRMLASNLPEEGILRLSSPVQSISQLENATMKVTTSNEQVILARRVILSVPTPLYKTISFSPPLPPAKKLVSDSSSYGYYTKVMLVFKTAFWTTEGYCGLAQSFTGPASVIRDTSIPADSKHMLTCFLAGEFGLFWSRLDEAAREEQLLDQVARMWTGGDVELVRKQFVESVAYEWAADEYSGWGCPCAALAPGVLDRVGGELLREVVGGIHFVGTETAGAWKGYMEGAVRSGERGAAEVVAALAK